MIIFFSGTGNSEYVAKRLGEALGDTVLDLHDRIQANNNEPIESERPWVVVSPTYAWRLPKVLTEYLEKTDLKGSKEVYFVLTCGGEVGNAAAYARKLCDKKGLIFRGLAEVVMPENYIAMFRVPEEAEAKAIIEKAEPVIDGIAEKIKAGADLSEDVNILDRFLSSYVNFAFYKMYVKDRAFIVNHRCNGCGLCERKCPLGNIRLVDGKPEWNGHCTHCMACICYCPQGAIEYGKASVGKPRYTCPSINDLKSMW